MTNFIKTFLQDEEGATAIEYGLIAGLIAVVIMGALSNIGERLGEIFSSIATQLGFVEPTPGP